MSTRTLLSVTIIISLTALINCDNYVFETNILNDPNRAPTLSNGHIGFVAYSDAVHINGVYNGETGESHRARIPNYGRVQFEMCGIFSQGDLCTYSLDIRQGIFNTTSEYDGYTVELVTYPHRYYDKTIVNHVTIRRHVPGTTGDPIKLILIKIFTSVRRGRNYGIFFISLTDTKICIFMLW